MNDVSNDILAVERACHRLIAELARCIDKRDLEGLRSVFVADGAFDRGEAVAEGIDAIIAFIGAIPPHLSMLHLYSNIVIDVAADGKSAVGSANYMAFIRSAKVEDPKAALTPASIGGVADRFVLTSDGWRFSRRTIERFAG